MLRWPQKWPVGAPPSRPLGLFAHVSLILGELSNSLIEKNISGSSCIFFTPTRNQLFPQDHPAPFSGEWYLETKIRVQRVLIPARVSLFLGCIRGKKIHINSLQCHQFKSNITRSILTFPRFLLAISLIPP